MPKKTARYEGKVDSLAVPVKDLPGKGACFTFGMSTPKHRPPDDDGRTAVFYLLLDSPHAVQIIELVLCAYRLGEDVQVGETKMIVDWVQLPRRNMADR